MTRIAKFTHRSYGLRRDGTLGPEEPGNPVAESAAVPMLPNGYVDYMARITYSWSDGTRGPVQHKDITHASES